jgi:phosphoribosylanthranilate isomerase
VYGRENGHRARDGVLLRGGERVATVIDLPWQENDPKHLERALEVAGRVMLAGGLAADNVGAAIDAVRPWAVDASSRLEVEPGVKDPERVRAYVEAARC